MYLLWQCSAEWPAPTTVLVKNSLGGKSDISEGVMEPRAVEQMRTAIRRRDPAALPALMNNAKRSTTFLNHHDPFVPGVGGVRGESKHIRKSHSQSHPSAFPQMLGGKTSFTPEGPAGPHSVL